MNKRKEFWKKEQIDLLFKLYLLVYMNFYYTQI